MINEYETHGNLNPKLWIDDILRKSLRNGFLKIAHHFYEFLEIDVPIQDIILIGSNANYNWTKYSDIDLHIIVNYLEIGDNLHLVQNYLHAKKSVWNSNYPLTFKGMNIELYAQDSNDNLHATVGIYSILNGNWIRKPNSKIISIDDDAITQKTKSYEYEIDALSEKDPKLEFKIKDLLLRLRNLRKSGLEAEGEYSLENLAYKSLRNSGHLTKLKTMLQSNTIGQLSINESMHDHTNNNINTALIMHISKRKILDEDGWQYIMKHMNAVSDPMGQWMYPGRCTLIPGNQITMQNVPHHVLGIDDVGHMKLMRPEQQYTYPGNKVFEIPVTAQYRTQIIQILNAIQNGSKYGN
jgi:hypothetical protein